jgi:hypothetical protein
VKKTASALMLILALLVSVEAGTQFIKSATAQTYSTITIKADGSIEGTDKIQQQGNTYTLTGDVFGSITVRIGGIMINGAGHTLEGRKIVDERGIDLVGLDEAFLAYGNVLVENLRIYNFYEGIRSPASNNNSFIGNFFDHSGIHILGGGSTANVVKRNFFVEAGIFVDYSSGGLDVITENNFVNGTIFVDLSKPPIVDKNYWSDYVAEYPDAKEVDSSGTWDTPYVYDKYVDGSHGDDPCIDYHPLKQPVEVAYFPVTPEPTPITKPFPITQIIGSVIAVAALVGLGLLVYLKKRRSTVVPGKSAYQKERTRQSKILENNISLWIGKTL